MTSKICPVCKQMKKHIVSHLARVHQIKETYAINLFELKYCQCVQKCGIRIYPWLNFYRNHNRTANLCLCGCRQVPRKNQSNYISGHFWKGKKHTETAKFNMSMSHTGKLRPEKRGKTLEVLYGAERAAIIKDTLSKAHIGVSHPASEAGNAKKSVIMKKKWESPEFAKKVLHRRPMSNLENAFLNLCTLNNLDYSFVGNGALLVGRKNPDFISRDFKRVIEIFGEYFHKKSDPQEKIDYYKKFGIDVLIIYGKEFKDIGKILMKIVEFEKLCQQN